MNNYVPVCKKHNIPMMVGGDGSTKYYYCKECDKMLLGDE